MEKHTLAFVNLGCDKNRIDGELALFQLNQRYRIVPNPEMAEIIIINTCGFIEASKQESINTILEMAKYKEKGKCHTLLATGCLTQRYGEELLNLMPELDGILGVNDYDKLIETIEQAKTSIRPCHCNFSNEKINEGERILSTEKGRAFIRISEGCDNACAYCAIPKIRGKYRSRPMESIIKEANALAEKGVKELIIVAQDTTRYGVDIYGEKKLHTLLNKISSIENIKWIRILYCYVEELTDDIISEIKNNNKVCKYLDIPIQHISDSVLKNMRRKGRRKLIENNIKKLKNEIPNIIIRTTLIVGFPGETEEDFKELREFVKETKFDRLGVFKFSKEEDTAAFDMENQISEEVKESREKEIMLLQQEISKKSNENKVGKVYNVIVDYFDGILYHGRSFEMAPEVDGEILFTSTRLHEAGDMLEVKIQKAMEYDLIGVEVDELS
ncbi:SSU ribosomal protein S12P methylthiotransferase [Hathewaya proteolytica DSM 3090]|uniref:Ribosomal protein uS12 methylthiotransferase RimO n=1 Tax=Hathewaya proteolytica DSM 3090 TaxID=1121331 RepID=A0A1M6J4L8_9CLOT|nr:30S ribosomal protein S12 methylthiotransferase RimO [Hathewaya proteolytica]SHJ41622.1 SSU ribosomal protein S12P methylthiotransferase [Hathewaya proteolytica DSM 3090]